jgi:16S rRNA C1402 N4-methylase RsmH
MTIQEAKTIVEKKGFSVKEDIQLDGRMDKRQKTKYLLAKALDTWNAFKDKQATMEITTTRFEEIDKAAWNYDVL